LAELTSENYLFEQLIQDILANGYGVIEDFIQPLQVTRLSQNLQELYQDGYFKKAGIGNTSNLQVISEIRGDYILWLNQDTSLLCKEIYFDKIDRLISYFNETCFLGIKGIEAHFALFPEGTFYKRHLDSFKNNDKRIFSVIFYLNENWKQENGGELNMYFQEKNIETLVSILPIAGRFLCFESHKIPHEVLVANKDRLSITGWLYGL